MATKPQATTNIVLDQFFATGRYTLNRPDQDTQGFESDQTLAEITAAAGLKDGYWLREGKYGRDGEVGARQRWTWVQL